MTDFSQMDYYELSDFVNAKSAELMCEENEERIVELEAELHEAEDELATRDPLEVWGEGDDAPYLDE